MLQESSLTPPSATSSSPLSPSATPSSPPSSSAASEAFDPRVVFVHVPTPDVDLVWGLTNWPDPYPGVTDGPEPSLRCWDSATGKLVCQMPRLPTPYTLLPILSASSDWICVGVSADNTKGTLVLNLNEFFHYHPEHCRWTTLASHNQQSLHIARGLDEGGRNGWMSDTELLARLLASGRVSVGPRELPWLRRRVMNQGYEAVGGLAGGVDGRGGVGGDVGDELDFQSMFSTPWLGECDTDNTSVRWDHREDTRNKTTPSVSDSRSQRRWRFLELLGTGARSARIRSIHVLSASAQIAAIVSQPRVTGLADSCSEVVFAGLANEEIVRCRLSGGVNGEHECMAIVTWKDTPMFVHPLGLRLLLQQQGTYRTHYKSEGVEKREYKIGDHSVQDSHREGSHGDTINVDDEAEHTSPASRVGAQQVLQLIRMGDTRSAQRLSDLNPQWGFQEQLPMLVLETALQFDNIGEVPEG